MELHRNILKMERKLRKMGMGDGVDRIKKGDCPVCGKAVHPNTEFKDDKSLREYTLSGLCQKCQDEYFGSDDE